MLLKTSVVLILGLCLAANAQPKTRILLAAASDLTFALDSIVSIYRKINPDVTVRVSYGSSGKLFEQISNGAPFDIFFSADIDYPRMLEQKGLTSSSIEVYGYGRIVVWSKKYYAAGEGLGGLSGNLIKKISIANPLHAPYGKRAVEALQYFKMYDGLKSKLVFGENISQAAQFVSSGAADAGIIALSLAASPVMKKMGGSYHLIPSESHTVLAQGYVILKDKRQKKEVQDFAEFVKGKEAKAILLYFGFSNASSQ